MRHLPLILLAAVATTTPALAAKPYVDLDKTFDFTRCQTFTWGEGTPANDINQRRIVEAVTRNLRAVGLNEASAGGGADLQVVTHVNVDRVVTPKASVGFGFGGWGGSGGIGVHTERPVGSKVNEVGNLAIQLYDPATDKLVWEAVISETVDANPEKLEHTINSGVDRAFKKYPVKPKK